jgi:hypothetical protein
MQVLAQWGIAFHVIPELSSRCQPVQPAAHDADTRADVKCSRPEVRAQSKIVVRTCGERVPTSQYGRPELFELLGNQIELVCFRDSQTLRCLRSAQGSTFNRQGHIKDLAGCFFLTRPQHFVILEDEHS